MCNLYSITKGQAAIREFTRAMNDRTGNMPSLPGVFPDYAAPIVREGAAGRELTMARWGMPSPRFVLQQSAEKRAAALAKKGEAVDLAELIRNTPDTGVTNIRNAASSHWRRWLAPDHRCLVPLTSFSEYDTVDGKKVPVWFALDESRPLAVFAGLWCNWTSVRKKAEGEVTTDLYGFLTTDPNAEVGAVHPKAMPVILTTVEEMDAWLRAPWGRGGGVAAAIARRCPPDRGPGRAPGRPGHGTRSACQSLKLDLTQVATSHF